MITEKLSIQKVEKKEYPLLKKGIYQCELLDVNLKDATGEYAKPGEKVLDFQFTILENKEVDGENIRCRNIWDNFVKPYFAVNYKTGEKNDLYKIVEAIIGRDLTQKEEAEGFDENFINSLIGQQVKVSVGEKVTKKGTKINIPTDYYIADSKLPSLTAEEKDKCTVKNKKEGNDFDVSEAAPMPTEEISTQNIPF